MQCPCSSSSPVNIFLESLLLLPHAGPGVRMHPGHVRPANLRGARDMRRLRPRRKGARGLHWAGRAVAAGLRERAARRRHPPSLRARRAAHSYEGFGESSLQLDDCRCAVDGCLPQCLCHRARHRPQASRGASGQMGGTGARGGGTAAGRRGDRRWRRRAGKEGASYEQQEQQQCSPFSRPFRSRRRGGGAISAVDLLVITSACTAEATP